MAITYTKDELGLINICLMAIGEVELPPGTVVALLPLGTDASAARQVVTEVALEILGEGWWFNTEYYYEFIPDGITNEITLTTNMLKVDFGNTENRGRIVVRQGKLYDLVNQTFEFEENVYGDVTWATEYEDMPVSAYQYIGLRAARKFQQRIIGAGELFEYTLTDERDALVSLQREQSQIQDYNLIDTRVVWRFANPHWTNIKRKY